MAVMFLRGLHSAEDCVCFLSWTHVAVCMIAVDPEMLLSGTASMTPEMGLWWQQVHTHLPEDVVWWALRAVSSPCAAESAARLPSLSGLLRLGIEFCYSCGGFGSNSCGGFGSNSRVQRHCALLSDTDMPKEQEGRNRAKPVISLFSFFLMLVHV